MKVISQIVDGASQRKGATTHLARGKHDSLLLPDSKQDFKSQSSVVISTDLKNRTGSFGKNDKRVRSIGRPRIESPVHASDYQEWRQIQLQKA